MTDKPRTPVPISSDHPIPSWKIRKPGRPPIYPWNEMAVGQSFLVKGISERTAQQMIYSRNRKSPKKYIHVVESDGIRVWRIE